MTDQKYALVKFDALDMASWHCPYPRQVEATLVGSFFISGALTKHPHRSVYCASAAWEYIQNSGRKAEASGGITWNNWSSAFTLSEAASLLRNHLWLPYEWECFWFLGWWKGGAFVNHGVLYTRARFMDCFKLWCPARSYAFLICGYTA